jgi:hypothetical protein
MNDFQLTTGDRISPLWEKLMQRNKELIDQIHRELAKPLAIEETNLLRGRLIELRAFERLEVIEPIVP